jgi:hypothetical protein
MIPVIKIRDKSNKIMGLLQITIIIMIIITALYVISFWAVPKKGD